ncbi:MAG: aminoglycoside phosphotransferase family protein [Actinomycetota bacterium]|nr:aminoglycoside phosphotransferase family protein [Actinomycetota bacterium]
MTLEELPRAAQVLETGSSAVSREATVGLAALVAEGALPPGRARVGADGSRRRPGDREAVEWDPDEGQPLVVKLYPDRMDGAASYRILKALWFQGFGRDSPYRVPEPLRWSEAYGAIVMRRAPGKRLGDHAPGEAGWLDALLAAAGWLARLHSSSLRVGPGHERSWAAQRLSRRMSKAVERHPRLADVLWPRMEELARRAPRNEPVPCQTHGRFHPGHVFVDRDLVTVIDLDRAAPAAPAKDVAEFIHRTRAEAFKRGWASQVAEDATQAFLDEYLHSSPVVLEGLTYFWSESLLATLLHAVRKRHLEADAWRERISFYVGEFDRVPERVAVYASGGTARSWSGT